MLLQANQKVTKESLRDKICSLTDLRDTGWLHWDSFSVNNTVIDLNAKDKLAPIFLLEIDRLFND